MEKKYHGLLIFPHPNSNSLSFPGFKFSVNPTYLQARSIVLRQLNEETRAQKWSQTFSICALGESCSEDFSSMRRELLVCIWLAWFKKQRFIQTCGYTPNLNYIKTDA